MSLSRPTLAYLCIFALATFLASLVVLAPSPSVGLFPAREAKSLREQRLDADGGAVWDHLYVINLESRQGMYTSLLLLPFFSPPPPARSR
jgi:hypothetical protein